MNRLTILTLLLLITGLDSFGQFYYNDVVVNQQHNRKHQQYKQLRVSRITATSLSPMEQPGTDPIAVEQQYNSSYSQLRTKASAGGARSSITNYYNPQGLLYRTVDSSENAVTTYDYQYEGERLTVLTSSSVPAGEKQRTVEVHAWTYNEQGCPLKMLRVRNGSDSSETRFVCDSQGRVTEEQVFRKNVGGEKIYYYYDDAGRLSDVVRYQEKLGKLIPDYTFDHDTEGRLTAMMVVQNGGVDYQTWRYEYNGQGLLVKESCFSRQKKLVGKLEYSYEMKR